MRHYATHREKTQRAMDAYLNLIDTADWLKSEARVPLDSFDLTMGEFRVLDLLNREGPLTVGDAARRRKTSLHNLKATSKYLEKRGWMRREVVTLPPAAFEASHKAKAEKNGKRSGRRIGAMMLTPSGKRFIRDVLPSHSKFVKALMRTLSSKEQMSVSRLCRKLRANDAVKFLREIRMLDEDQEALELREKVEAELERLSRAPTPLDRVLRTVRARMRMRGRGPYGHLR
jgi:DNA-binding MarR family transcriptional regulator